MTVTNVSGLKVTLQFEFDYDEPVGPQVAAVQQLVSALVQERATVAVAIEDVTPPANPIPPKRRGRPPILPQETRVETAQPLAAAGNGTGAEDLMTPPATKAKPSVVSILDDADTEDDDAADPFGLPSAGRTGKEALEQALGGLRNMFNAKHRTEVKAIQTAFGVAQFSDIEAKDGHKLLAMVEAAAQKVGMRV
jgi:hypothetical protein